jgi:hypothetical protein
MATQGVQLAGAVAESPSHTEPAGFALFALFVVIALLIVLSALITRAHKGENRAEDYKAEADHSNPLCLAHVQFFLRGIATLQAVIRLTRLMRHSYPNAALWGLALSAMGFVSWGGYDGTDFKTCIAGSSSHLDTYTMQSYIPDALTNSAILLPTTAVFLLLVAGPVVTGVGLHRSSVLPFWLGMLLPIGVVGVRRLRARDGPALRAAPDWSDAANGVPKIPSR